MNAHKNKEAHDVENYPWLYVGKNNCFNIKYFDMTEILHASNS